MTEIMGLNIFDIAVIGLILLLSIKGLLNGFTKELFGAIGLIGGIFVASYFHKTVAGYIHNNVTDALSINALNVIALVVIFVLFLVVVTYIGKGAALIGDDDHISTTSRLGGMLVKIIKLFFIFALIIFGFSSKPKVAEKFKDTLSSSKLYPLLKNTGASILNLPIIANINLSKKAANNNVESSNTEANSVENNTTAPKEEKKTTEANTTAKTTKAEVTKTETNATEANNTVTAETNSSKVEEKENNITSQDTNSSKN